MTRSLTARPVHRRCAAAATAALALVLTACGGATELPSAPPESSSSATSPSPSPSSPSDDPTGADPGSAMPADLSLAANPQFPAGTLPQIAEGLLVEPGWEYTSPDDGQGHWGYTETATGCTVDLYQNQLSAAAIATGDDEAATVQHLAETLQVSAADVETNANPLVAGQSAGVVTEVEVLTVLMSSASSTRFTFARAFVGAEAAMSVSVGCATSEGTTAATATLLENFGVMTL